MRADRVVRILEKGIPEKMACWSHEAYGGYNINRRADIKKVLYCVTPNAAMEGYAQERGYDLIFCHHPFKTDMPQFIAHTALDCCEGGLNDQFKEMLGIKNVQYFDGMLGPYGEIDPLPFGALCQKVERFIKAPIIGQKASKLGDEPVRSVAVCTGLGGSVNSKARATGVDCYILGEATQSFEDSGFKAMIECGHTNTEWIGVNLVRELLAPHGIVVHRVPVTLDRYSQERYVPWKSKFDSYKGGKWDTSKWDAILKKYEKKTDEELEEAIIKTGLY